MININSPLSAIVKEHPSAAAVFLAHGIDFCCGGHQNLREACAAVALSPTEIVSELESRLLPPDGLIDVETCSLAELQAYIVRRHHAFAKMNAPTVLQLLKKIAQVHGSAHPELLEVERLFAEAAEELLLHMEKEEKMLFPLIGALDALGAVAQQVELRQMILIRLECMEREHAHEGSHFKRMAELTCNFAVPADSCTTYQAAFSQLRAFRDDVFFHIHLENNVLFPRTRALLAAS